MKLYRCLKITKSYSKKQPEVTLQTKEMLLNQKYSLVGVKQRCQSRQKRVSKAPENPVHHILKYALKSYSMLNEKESLIESC